MGGPGLRVLLALSGASLACAGYSYEEPVPDDALEDDFSDGVKRLRDRIATQANLTEGSLGVVMVVGPKESVYAQLTIPVWRAYCARHGMPFFLQEERLNTDLPFEWAKPRVLMELLPKVSWRYLLIVDPNTLPLDFNRTWEYMVKQYMRFKRYSNDEPDKRYIFCPWDCDAEYKSAYEDGACSGPQMSGCIFWAKKPRTQRMVRYWYAKRNDDDLVGADNRLIKAFEKMKEKNYENVFYQDVAADVGRRHSKFIVSFAWDKDYKWNLRDQIYDFIKKHKHLAEVANAESKKEEL